MGRWLARRLMQECGLESRQPGRHRYRGVKEEAMASPDLLRRRFTPETPDKAWSGDISYVRVNGGCCAIQTKVANTKVKNTGSYCGVMG